ncbi:MAG: stage 0 sporulation protein [Clostridiales bacterium]|nr:stage 0 sporulation protein [Clostridiales bacterium]
MSKIGIKFVKGGKVFVFDNNNLEVNIDDKVVVETVRGLEIGMVTTAPKDEGEEEIKAIIRLATDEDLKKIEDLKKQESRVISITNSLIEKYNLEMKLVSVSFTLDGGKVIINYICEDRVDFRELVKDLASQLRLRIELRQIGIRDQAKIIGGIGFCGKECCCKQYLNDFDKVSIKMAKTQGLSLNPTKISGICGRLMCCLSYENDFYAEIAVKMPKLNAKVKTKDGVGTVVYNNLLKQKVTVRIEEANEIKVNEYDLNDIVVLPKTPPVQKSENKVQEDKEKSVDKEQVKTEKSQDVNKENFKTRNKFKKKNKKPNDTKR